MAIPAALLAGLISAGGSAGSSFMDRRADKKAAKRRNQHEQRLANQEHHINTNMMHYQNQWNLDQWNRANEYNSPIQQMQRFSEAGLNPHLIYGKGSHSAGTAAPLRSVDAKPYNRVEVRSVGEGLNTFSNIARQMNLNAQTNNVRAMTQVHEQEAANKAQEQLIKAVDLKQKKVNLGVSRGIADYAVDSARVNLESANQDLRTKKMQNNILDQTQNTQIEAKKQELLNLARDGKIKQLDVAIKSFQAYLTKQGLTQSDNVVARWLYKNAPWLQEQMKKAGSAIINPFNSNLNHFQK